MLTSVTLRVNAGALLSGWQGISAPYSPLEGDSEGDSASVSM